MRLILILLFVRYLCLALKDELEKRAKCEMDEQTTESSRMESTNWGTSNIIYPQAHVETVSVLTMLTTTLQDVSQVLDYLVQLCDQKIGLTL